MVNKKSINERWDDITKNLSDGEKICYQKEISYKACSLENRINQYLKWYSSNILTQDKSINKEEEKKKLYNFIEKMAVWYELRFPDSKVLELTNFDAKNLFLDLYDYSAFFNQLTKEEQAYLMSPTFPRLVYVSEKAGTHFHLSLDGKIEIDEYSKDKSKFQGKHILDVHKYLSQQGISSYELNKVVNNYIKDSYKKEELLNSIMYRIIERGGLIGSKRALLFAKEFKRDIEIPIKYGVKEENLIFDLDQNTKAFLNEYLRLGGSIYLSCYLNYHTNKKMVGVVSLIDILANSTPYLGDDKNLIKLQVLNIIKAFLLEREKELGISVSEVRKIKEDKVYQKRLERRLLKSKNR